MFLHSCFYRLEPTKITIESYFTLRTHSPELFTKRDTELQLVLDAFKTMYKTLYITIQLLLTYNL